MKNMKIIILFVAFISTNIKVTHFYFNQQKHAFKVISEIIV